MFARRFAIACGNRIKSKTNIAEAQRRIALSKLGWQLHCLARQDW